MNEALERKMALALSRSKYLGGENVDWDIDAFKDYYLELRKTKLNWIVFRDVLRAVLRFSFALDLSNWKVDQVLGQLESSETINDWAKTLNDGLTNVPKEYTFAFGLEGLDLSKEFSPIPISRDVFISFEQRNESERSYPEEVISSRVLRKSREPAKAPSGWYIYVTAEGYYAGAVENSAFRFAAAKLKQAIMLMNIYGSIDFDYGDRGADIYLGTPNSYVEEVPGVSRVLGEISRVILKDKMLEEFEDFNKPIEDSQREILTLLHGKDYKKPKPRLLDGDSKIILDSLDDDRITGDIKNSLEWAFDAYFADSETHKLINLSISLEALLGEGGKKGDKGVTERLADRCAFILGRNIDEREEIRLKFDSFYDVRSKLIHGRGRLEEQDQRIVENGRSLFVRLIKRFLFLSEFKAKS